MSVPCNTQGPRFNAPVTHSALRKIKEKGENVKCRIKRCHCHHFKRCCRKSNGHKSHRASPVHVPYVNFYSKHAGNNLCWHGNPLLQRRLRPNESRRGTPFSVLLRRRPSNENRVINFYRNAGRRETTEGITATQRYQNPSAKIAPVKRSHCRRSATHSALKWLSERENIIFL